MKKLILGLSVAAAVFSAQATVVSFDEAGYTAGALDEQGATGGSTWNASGNTVDPTGGGSVVLATGTDTWKYGVFRENLRADSGNNDFTVSQTISWTENAETGNNDAFSLLFNDTLNGTSTMRAYLNRSGTDSYKLGIKTDLGEDLGGSTFSETLFGLDDLGDTTSDSIKFSFNLVAGASSNDWSYTISLYNETTASDIGVISDSEITTSEALFTAGNLYGGFSSSRNESTHGLTDRVITSFEVAAVPEPATLGMISAIGIGILFIRRRFMM
ncbi:PEP-CTERM sorting domain-containing protein [Pontiella agarivorans]|uniref:PEP-CTERM sorting domain-containing protein n=1 Tax=Pontiella agarivorans TaxID=3038953 RepID=A0ABU5N251_9BACT|nr:PEP-CTERM sorting domain-containing protein [Pontiella agarivorans]MDZ8120501.1 PEP-CTERM sorting domain-containing protein [Pontiella agarivorans]